MAPLTRRSFIRNSALAAGAFAGWPRPRASASPPPFGIDMTASVGPVDHVIVLMMENRSFDHYFGWTTNTQHQVFVDHPDDPSHPNHGNLVDTYRFLDAEPDHDYRGCGHPDPSHSWSGGRQQIQQGFLTGRNDDFAVGYYDEGDLDFYTALANEFTLCDNYFCSVMGPTYPNREYMHSAQSGGQKSNNLPPEVPGHETGFSWPTIWDLCNVNDVPWGYYFVDLPAIGLFGSRNANGAHHIENFFADLADGTLPNVSFVDPGFLTGLRTDEHPYSDVRAGQAFVHNVVKSVVESPLWPRTALFINYDEWGGFFDHALPPRAPDVRATDADPGGSNDFGQLGFRVPCLLVSPYARQGVLASDVVNDSSVFFEHCSILNYVESLMLRGRRLTRRDAAAADIGAALLDLEQAPRLDAAQIVDLLPRPLFQSCPCDGEAAEGTGPGGDVEEGAGDGFEQLAEFVEGLSGFEIGSPEISDICGPLP